jgi:hypothetical protein
MRRIMIAAGLALAIAGSGCTGGPRAAIEGVTQYRVCGGAPPPPGVDACQPPTPVPATVTVRDRDAVVATVRSDASGRFRVRLAPGTYQVQASLDPGAPFVNCPAIEVSVLTTVPVTLTCSLLAP